MDLQLKATIICPSCGFEKKETMPTNACQFFYKCEKCNFETTSKSAMTKHKQVKRG